MKKEKKFKYLLNIYIYGSEEINYEHNQQSKQEDEEGAEIRKTIA